MPLSLLKLTILLAVVAVPVSGCSISYSIGKSSDSVKSISDSSGPSATADNETAYRNDLNDFTVASVQSGQPAEAYLQSVSRIAEAHGITDWEHERNTYLAIGAGLKQAGLGREEVPRLALVRSLTETQPDTMAAILAGYRS